MFQSTNVADVQPIGSMSAGATIQPHGDGSLIKLSSKVSTKGSLKLVEEGFYQNSRGYLEPVRKVAFLRADVVVLQQFVKMYSGKAVPGRIYVQEMLEGSPECDAKIAPDLEYFKGDYAQAIGKKAKVNPKTGEYLCANGVRIIRFVEYDMYGRTQDVFIQHDKNAGVSAFQKAVEDTKSSAELPTGDDSPEDNDQLPF